MTPDTDRVDDQRTTRGGPVSGTSPVPEPRTGDTPPSVDDSPTGEIDLPRSGRAADVDERRVPDEAGTAEGESGPAHDEAGLPDGEAGLPDDDEDLEPGPLRGDVLGRIAGATTAIVATSDRHGVGDVSILGGPRCFLRVIDRHRFAFPDTGVEPMTAARSNLAEAPGVAMMLLVGTTGRALHLNGTARVVPAEELRAEDPTVPADPVPGETTDVWVVVEVGDIYPLDGEQAPRLGGAPPAPAPAAAPTSAGRGARFLVALLAVALVAMLAVAGVALATRPAAPAAAAPPPPPPAPVVDPGPTGPPTLLGRVTEVRDPATVVVDVAGRPVTVAIVGLDAATVPACARADSLDFARSTLAGQTVTLVPDPTLPQQPGLTRAYAVLGTQLSYTDAAIRGGHAPAAGLSQYGGVFDSEQSDAQNARVGMWGPPCVR